MRVAALYVEAGGVYCGLTGVEPWDAEDDARRYAGPYPVIAHPPCERWGRYWWGGPSWKGEPLKMGDDDGCFMAALDSVRRWGGVLEHPADSHAWDRFCLNRPPRTGGWIPADFVGGWTCCVDQGHYGHRGWKRTWLYAFGTDLPSLKWGRAHLVEPPRRNPLPEGRRASRTGIVQRLSHKQRQRTPEPFRDVLLEMARSVYLKSRPGVHFEARA